MLMFDDGGSRSRLGLRLGKAGGSRACSYRIRKMTGSFYQTQINKHTFCFRDKDSDRLSSEFPSFSYGTMGRKGWPTKEQREFLKPLIDVFLEAQQAGTTTDFFDQTFDEFKVKFPLPAPTKKQLQRAKDNKKGVEKVVEIFWKKVRKLVATSLHARTHVNITSVSRPGITTPLGTWRRLPAVRGSRRC